MKTQWRRWIVGGLALVVVAIFVLLLLPLRE
jgi:hypothetical protein